MSPPWWLQRKRGLCPQSQLQCLADDFGATRGHALRLHALNAAVEEEGRAAATLLDALDQGGVAAVAALAVPG